MIWHRHHSATALLRRLSLGTAVAILLSATGVGTLHSQEVSMTTSADLAERATREISELHQFFQGWFHGTLAEGDFARFERVLDADFTIVTPAGRTLGRDAILAAVQGQFGRDSTTMLEIRNVIIHQVIGEVAIVSYEEWQLGQETGSRGRQSTAVLSHDPATPNQLRWLRVHETWLPSPPAP